jgi:type VI secretion system protein ImpC
MSDTQAVAASAQTETITLLDRIVHDGRMAHDEEQQHHARELLAEFALQVLDKNMVVSRDTVAMINDHISRRSSRRGGDCTISSRTARLVRASSCAC